MLSDPSVRPGRAGSTVVAGYLFDGMSAFELGCVTEVFALPRPELDVPWYEFRACAETTRPLRALGGFSLIAGHGMDEFAAADTLIVTAVPDVRRPVSPALVAALRTAHERGARIVSICSGAFALADAGLLDGRTATTHWRYAEVFRRRFPRVRLNPDVLYVADGPILTGAGSAAGLDLCLHLVRLDHGSAVANSVAQAPGDPAAPGRRSGAVHRVRARYAGPARGGGPLDADGRWRTWPAHRPSPTWPRSRTRRSAATCGTSPGPPAPRRCAG